MQTVRDLAKGLAGTTVLLAMGLTQAAAQRATPTALPLKVHAGTLMTVERVQSPVRWIALDTVLAKADLDPETVDEDALVDRPPAAAQCYAVWTLELESGRSVSRYDYRLRHAGGTVPCLAMRRGSRPYDRRILTLTGPERASLLFEVPADAQHVSLEFALATTVPQPGATGIPFGDQPVSPDGETAPPVQEPAQPADQPGEETSTPAAAPPPTKPKSDPEPKPEPRPGPQPKPEPKVPAKPKGANDLGDLF